MASILQYLLAIGMFQGFLLTALLLFTPNVNYASRILGIWCGFLAIGLLLETVLRSSLLARYGLLLSATGFLPATYGALLYLYCRHSVLDDGFQTKDIAHLVPFLACYLLNIDLLLSPEQVQHAYADGMPVTSARFNMARFILFAQAYVYMFFSARLLRRIQLQAQQNYAGYNAEIFGWLWVVQGFNFTIWTLKTVDLVADDMLPVSTGVMGDILIVVLIYSIGLAQWRNQQLFKIAVPEQERQGLLPAQSTEKSARLLDADTRERMLDTVFAYMQSSQAFLDQDLSLRKLADAVGISPHHLSEVLNQQDGQNFYNFVNKQRVDHVCRELEQGSDLKVLDLGLAAGFATKSTFNSVFKKYTGMTPTQYRQQVSKHGSQ